MHKNDMNFVRLYQIIDSNKDGFCSTKEMNDLIKKIGLKLSINDQTKVIKHFDANGDQKIS